MLFTFRPRGDTSLGGAPNRYLPMFEKSEESLRNAKNNESKWILASASFCHTHSRTVEVKHGIADKGNRHALVVVIFGTKNVASV